MGQTMKKISFYPWEEFGIPDIYLPGPASRFIPKWLSGMSRYLDKQTGPRITSSSQTNMTVKSCPPFLDSMISGYTICLSADVFVEKNKKESVDFLWKSALSVVDGHATDQVSKEQIPDEYFHEPFKWINRWSVQLPHGYSAIFVHPLNRTDLPFYTFSGTVDLDTYHLPVHFPFILKKDFEGLIPAGTPIAQIIPVKRESWSHEIGEFDKKSSGQATANFLSSAFNGYKKRYWHRKEYK